MIGFGDGPHSAGRIVLLVTDHPAAADFGRESAHRATQRIEEGIGRDRARGLKGDSRLHIKIAGLVAIVKAGPTAATGTRDLLQAIKGVVVFQGGRLPVKVGGRHDIARLIVVDGAGAELGIRSMRVARVRDRSFRLGRKRIRLPVETIAEGVVKAGFRKPIQRVPTLARVAHHVKLRMRRDPGVIGIQPAAHGGRVPSETARILPANHIRTSQ